MINVIKVFFGKHRKMSFFIVGILLLLSLFLSYSYYVERAKKITYQLFDFTNTISWQESKSGIYRVGAKKDYDSLLLSRDIWADFEWSFKIINVRQCGVVFNYKNDTNFYFLYFDKPNNYIIWGLNQDGASHLIKRQKISYGTHVSASVKKKGGLVELFIENTSVSKINLPESNGSVGFLLKDASDPKIIFNNNRIKGTLNSGDFVISGDESTGDSFGFDRLISLLILFTLLILSSIYGAEIYGRFFKYSPLQPDNIKEDKTRINFISAAVVHLVLTIILFWPFVFKGHVLVSSSDNFGEIFPLYFLSKHNFSLILQGKSLCLWNPYTHNGIPFFSNHWSMIYYPLNWLVFLFSDKNVLSALTFRQFVEVFLIGLCAYRFFAIELRSKKWALFCSIIYQMCSLLIFSLSIFPAISLFFAMTLYLYVLWSAPCRKSLPNYIALTLSVFLILTSANVAFVFYAIVAITAISLYRILSFKEERMKNSILVGLSFVTGFLIGAVRILPCFLGIADSNRIVENYFTLHDRLPMITRLFIPEIAGWFGSGAFNALTSSNLNLIFQQANLPSNSQNTFFVYFGIIPAIILVVSIFIKAKKNYLFWKTYAFVTIAFGLLLQPFWGFLSIITFPLNHYSYYIVIIPIGVCTLIGHTAIYLCNKKIPLKEIGKKCIVGLIVIEAYILVIITYVFPSLTVFSRCVFLLSAGWYIIYKLLVKYKRQLRALYLWISCLSLEVFLWIGIFILSAAVLAKPLLHKENLAHYNMIPFLMILGAILTAVTFYASKRIRKMFSLKLLISISAIAMIATVVFAHVFASSNLFSDFLNWDSARRTYCIDFAYGQIKFVSIALIVIFCMILYKIKLLSGRAVFTLLILITAVDLVIFNFRFDNVVAPSPFYQSFSKRAFPYRDIDKSFREKMDLVNYRCSHLDKAGLSANKNLIFNVPSYSGIVGYMPKRFSDFIMNFGYPKDTILIYPADSLNDERFLDLSAVKYTFDEGGNIVVRPRALSRLSLIYSYEIIEDQKSLLLRLKDISFNPRNSVLLSEKPSNILKTKISKDAEFVGINQVNSDKIISEFTNEFPAVLLLTESYDKGWKAYDNGTEMPIYSANYNFMACVLNPGRHNVEFVFKPSYFNAVVLITFFGVLMFIAFGVVFAIQQRKKV